MLGLFGYTKRYTINGFFKRKKVDISQSNRWTSANQIAALYPRVRKSEVFCNIKIRFFRWCKHAKAKMPWTIVSVRCYVLLCVDACCCMFDVLFFYVAVRYFMLRYLAVLLLYVAVFFYVAVPCCTVVVQKAQAGRKGLNSAWLNSVRWLIVSCCTLL